VSGLSALKPKNL